MTNNLAKKLFSIINKRVSFFILFVLVLFLLFWGINFYFKNTEKVPAFGGSFVEGIVGQPSFINPIYASTNDVDRDLVELIFSGLMKYDSQGNIVPDLAQNYEIKDEGKVYEFELKENILWHDKVSLTSDDVIFTIQTIQNSDYKSPEIANWLGVEVKKISDRKLYFKLKNPYPSFLENTTLKIIPKHIWKDISVKRFPLAIDLNLFQPIGSGPYTLKKVNQDKLGFISSIELEANKDYYDKIANISKILFQFFEKEEDLIYAAKNKEIDNFSIINFSNYNSLDFKDFQLYNLKLPRYFAVFFNQKNSEVLKELEVRRALNYGTNKIDIIKTALFGFAEAVDSPILPNFYIFDSPENIYQFDKNKAEEILDSCGFLKTETGKREKVIKKKTSFLFESDLKLGSRGSEVEKLQECLAKDSQIYEHGKITGYFGEKTKEAVINFQEKYADSILKPHGFEKGTGIVGKSTREKLNEICLEAEKEKTIPLKFSLTTVDQPTLKNVANILKLQWEDLGAEIEIKTLSSADFARDIIKPRNYESLLFGQALGSIPDPFSFWHSSQKRDPGLNLSLYENKKSDKLLEEARISSDQDERTKKYQEMQNILIEDAPCVFLYNPYYLYLTSKNIKGIELKKIINPSKRFDNTPNWYTKTKRAWKK